MADDAWGSWQPASNPTAKAQEAYQHRRALSRGLSADPMSPGAPGPSRPFGGRPAPSFAPVRPTVPPASSSSARRALPEQSFPGAAGGRGNFGPSRSGAGSHRSPPRGHLDRGWASKTGHEEPIAKPVIVGDIESASNAPLTEAQRREQENTRSSRQDIEDSLRPRPRPSDDRRDLHRSSAASRDSKRPRSRSRERVRDRERDRHRDGDRDRYRERYRDRDTRDRERDRDYGGDRDRKRARRDDDDDRRRRRERSRSRSRSRDRTRRNDDLGHNRKREVEINDPRREDRHRDREQSSVSGISQAALLTSLKWSKLQSSRPERPNGRESSRQTRAESPERRRISPEDVRATGSSQTQKSRERCPVPKRANDPASALYGPKKKNYGIIMRNVAEGSTVEDIRVGCSSLRFYVIDHSLGTLTNEYTCLADDRV